jgi:type II secretory pathway pseudopilin PulG
MSGECNLEDTPEKSWHQYSCLSKGMSLPSDAGGFTYVGALILVIVTGIAISAASTYWSTMVRREKEAELLFRGDQIRKAIGSYYEQAPPGHSKSYPSSLKDLIRDPRYMKVVRHLRKIYRDPMTEDGQWGLILDGRGRIKGVFSKSKERPIKVGNFPKGYENFEKAKTYQDWKFVYVPKVSIPKKVKK